LNLKAKAMGNMLLLRLLTPPSSRGEGAKAREEGVKSRENCVTGFICQPALFFQRRIFAQHGPLNESLDLLYGLRILAAAWQGWVELSLS